MNKMLHRSRHKGLYCSMLTAMLVPVSALALPVPSDPCFGMSNCSSNTLRYSDGSSPLTTVTEFSDGSGRTTEDYLSYNTIERTWDLNNQGDRISYQYHMGQYDDYGYPIMESINAFASGRYNMAAGSTLDLNQVSAAGSGGGRITNLADGVNAMDAVNKRQLDAAIASGGADPLAVKYTNSSRNAVDVGGQLKSVSNGTAGTDAVNLNQLNAVNTTATNARTQADLGVTNAATAQARADLGVANAATAKTQADLGVTNAAAARARADLAVTNAAAAQSDVDALEQVAVKFTTPGKTVASVEGARLTMLADGVDASDAVNKGQLDALADDMANIAGDALLFDGTTYNAARDGVATRISGVADGVDAGDAVNKGQLDAVADGMANIAGDALLFDGTTYNAARGGVATRISGVADGVDAGDAVNKGQLDAVADDVASLSQDALLFDGTTYSAARGGVATRISGVADGVDAGDAVNKGQLDAVAGDVAGLSQDALLFDGTTYNAARGGVATRISGVAAGVAGTDAVNFDQAAAMTAIFGGGASWSNGSLTAPGYNIGGVSYSNIGDAFAAVDMRFNDLDGRVTDVENSPGGTRSVIYDDNSRDAITLEGNNGTRISNVAAGVAGTDAANVAQVQEVADKGREYTDKVASETLRDANAYTDSKVQDMWQGLDDMTTYMDDRFHRTDQRINRQAAATAALVNMGMNAAGSRSERGRVGAGIGFASGERALSVGYSRAFGRASFSLGGAISGGEKSAGVGIGFDL